METILITGGAGFIGSNIVRKCVELNYNVVVLDNLLTGNKENIKEFLSSIKFIEGDIRNENDLISALKNVDYILHQAAIPSVPRSIKEPLVNNEINITGFLKLLEAAKEKKIKKIVYASSSSVYGANPVLPKQEDLKVEPLSPYAVAKITNEYYAKIYSRIHNLPTIGLRYFNVFGPNQNPKSEYSAVIPKFIYRIINNLPLEVYGDGEQTRDFTFVENVVSANLLALKSEDGIGDVFNIGCGDRISLNYLIENLKKIFSDKKIEVKYLEPRAGDVKHSSADISKAEKILGFKTIINFAEGLKITVDYFLKKVF
ncbi:MAG TPA: SDR family oxidoreductase [bacterium]|nr:SDR family oxidoreductase [bacterium]HOL48251.1 SDR family oxidoreductase [bacterium]HPQ19368.1 SDR family oxidoreductase [bacterium]